MGLRQASEADPNPSIGLAMIVLQSVRVTSPKPFMRSNVLQIGLNSSVNASRVRIVATLLGTSGRAAAALLIGAEAVALLAGILVTVILCYLVRLDLNVRQACLTVPIVEMWHRGSIIHVTYERTTAIVQFAREQFRWQVCRWCALRYRKTLDRPLYGAE
ncbi:MAG: hypothetical protein JWO19_3326 [Bryobacterales bacterium]|nr:hypothetical protein [Bryobacterales bacterium]